MVGMSLRMVNTPLTSRRGAINPTLIDFMYRVFIKKENYLY